MVESELSLEINYNEHLVLKCGVNSLTDDLNRERDIVNETGNRANEAIG